MNSQRFMNDMLSRHLHLLTVLFLCIVVWQVGTWSAIAFVLLALLSFGQSKPPPNSPVVVGNWLPWIGHLIHYGMTPMVFLKACRERYGPIYQFLAGGRYIVVLSSPASIANFLQNSAKAFDVIQFQMIGVITGIPEPKRMPFLYPIIENKALPSMGNGLTKKNFVQAAIAFNLDLHKRLLETVGAKPEATVSLVDFVQRTMYASNSVAFLGPHFSLDTCDDFIAFDEDIPMIMRGLSFMGRRGLKGREAVVASLSEYIDNCWREEDGGYLEGGSDAMSFVVRELRSSGMSSSEATRILFGFLWGANSNHIRIVFWVMAFILTDRDAYARVQKEIMTALTDKYSDINTLLGLDPAGMDGPEFSLLTSAIIEVMRMTALPGSFREAFKDSTILDDNGQPILIQKGNYVTADIRGMHYDPTLYEDPETFKIDRFLSSDGTFKFPNEKTFVVFGGGSHNCKGRYYAIHSIRMFVILCFHLFDMQAVSVGGSAVSRPKFNPTSFAPVVRTRDALWVSLRRRAST